ncbi:MAG: hypothetical protein U0105_17290 [Candidatus Obscuribacterales bacterium]
MNLLNGSKKNYARLCQTIDDYNNLKKPSIADDEAQAEYNKASKKLSSLFKAEAQTSPRDYRLHFKLIDVAIGRLLDKQGFVRDPETGMHNPQVIQNELDAIELEVEIGNMLSEEDIASLQAEDPNVDEDGNRQLTVGDAIDAAPPEGEAKPEEPKPSKGKGRNKDDGSTAEAASDVSTRKMTEEEAVAS